jgi:UDP-N-acetylglucosamine diphosphorylase/glucosamine-1-phosphate N-acetyltransferase
MGLMTNAGIIILAAGLGTRMKSDKAKVLHEICGRPMIQYVIESAIEVVEKNVIVVVGHQAHLVQQALSGYKGVSFALQEKQLGTGHAVSCALPRLSGAVDDVVILCGDVPLIRPETIQKLICTHQTKSRDITLLGVAMADPKGYGRILFDDFGQLAGIVEEADADERQKSIDIVNSGIYAIRCSFLSEALPQIKPNNKQHEIYLTDIIALGYQQKRIVGLSTSAESDEIIGVNSPDDLRMAENTMKLRIKMKNLDLAQSQSLYNL